MFLVSNAKVNRYEHILLVVLEKTVMWETRKHQKHAGFSATASVQVLKKHVVLTDIFVLFSAHDQPQQKQIFFGNFFYRHPTSPKISKNVVQVNVFKKREKRRPKRS